MAMLIACMLLAGSALATGLVEMDSALYYGEFLEAYDGYIPIDNAPAGTGPKSGESWSIGDLEATRGGEYRYVVNCSEWVSLREEASTTSARIRKVYYGEEVCVLGTWYDWALVFDFNYDRYGWILLDYLSAYRPSNSYDADVGCDYDLEADGAYWYNSSELLDYIGNPISPAAASLGLSYSGRVPVGGDDAVRDCYVNSSGDLKLIGDDQWGIVEIELSGTQGAYTLFNISIGMSVSEAFNAADAYCYDCYCQSILANYQMCLFEDHIGIEFELQNGAIGTGTACFENNRITGIELFLL